MLLNDLLNGTTVMRWKRRGDDIEKTVTTGPNLTALRQLVPVDKQQEEK